MSNQCKSIFGVVKEVRPYRDRVIVFIQATWPKKIKGKLIRFNLDCYECVSWIIWIGLMAGDEVQITCTPKREFYKPMLDLKITKTAVIAASDYFSLN